GGGLWNRGTLYARNCTFDSNVCTGGSTPLCSNGARSGGGLGGGVGNTDETPGGIFHLTNCTLSENSVISGAQPNSLPGFSRGGGIFQGNAGFLLNTIVAGNFASTQYPDVWGSISSYGHNIIGATDGSTGWVSSDLTGTAIAPQGAGLNPLLDN